MAKAWIRDRYGPPDVLRIADVATPRPADDQVLVRVRAAAVSRADAEIMVGSPLWVRLVGFGLLNPKNPRLGADFAGEIEAVGRGVTAYHPGDAICGNLLFHGMGAFAEYVVVPTQAPIARKPSNISFAAAASVPEGALIAVQAIRDQKSLTRAHQVLINGAGGGAGTLAIQYAKTFGAVVTAVDHADKQSLMRELGADHVIDFTLERLAAPGCTYDLIVDIVGARSLREWAAMLKPNGVYVAVGGSMRHIARTLTLGKWLGHSHNKRMGMLGVDFNSVDLEFAMGLIEARELTTAVEKTYAFEQLPDAMHHVLAETTLGKVVITT